MALPELTDEERHAALNKAMQTRMARAEYKKLMKMGEATPEQALDASVVQHMHVDEWLRALPGIGPKRAAKIMDEVGIAPTRRVQGLGVRQRAACRASECASAGCCWRCWSMSAKGYRLYRGRWYPADPGSWEGHTCGTCDMWQDRDDGLGECAVRPRREPVEPGHPACPRWAWGWGEE